MNRADELLREILAADDAFPAEGSFRRYEKAKDDARAYLNEKPHEPPRDDAARKLYAEHTSNDPIIHCNRFPSWDELEESSKDQYRRAASPPHAAAEREKPMNEATPVAEIPSTKT